MIKTRSPFSPTTKRDRPSTPNTRSPIPPNKTAIALLMYIDDYVRINSKQVVEP